MSLSGLDSTILKEAYDGAVTEPGGWFLLSYATRDEIELLDRGSGGIVQIRKRIAEYEEESPLFGFLTYRRRKVLIKYIPEGVSRLVQARVTVHFGAVTDRFTPSTVFEIQSSKELKDSTLSAACSLHTASGSTSSSTSSLRQRRLIEIEEEEEDNRRQSILVEEHSPETAAASIDESSEDYRDDNGYEASTSGLPELLKADTYQSPDSQPHPDPDHEPEHLSLVPTISIEPAARPSTDPDSSRTSANTERPSFAESTRSEVSTHTSYTTNGRPKVKLGPRPSSDTPAQALSGAASSRPVSSLPAGLKLLSRNSKKTKDRVQPTASQKTLLSPTMEGVVSTPHEALGRPLSSGRPTSSSGASIRSTVSTCTVTSHMSTASPDQAKLMKALELRKKKKAASANAQTQTDLDPTQVPLPVDNNELAEALVPIPTAVEPDDTAQSSVAASPVEAADPETESTAASSLSDATDETVKGHNEGKSEDSILEPSGPTPTAEPLSADTEKVPSILDEAPTDSKDQLEDQTHSQDATEKVSIKESELPAAAPAIVKTVEGLLEATTASIKPQAVETNEVADEVKPEPGPTPILKTASSKPELQINGKSNDEVNLLHAPPGPHPVVEAYPPALDKSVESMDGAEDFSGTLAASTEFQDPQADAVKREMKIPTSKFSVQKENEQPKTAVQADTTAQAAPKRRTLIAPIITDPNAKARPASDLFNDDDLMDELQSATVQEAKPISLPKSPGRAMFSQDIKGDMAGDRVSRAVSNPHQLLASQQRPEPLRSASASWLNRSSQQPAPLVKKVNLGGGIAQRIKALEKLSTTTGGAAPASQAGAAAPPGPSPAFFGVGRRGNGGSAQSIAERASSLTRRPPSSASVRGGDSSPEQQFMGRGRTLSSASRQENSTYSHSPMGLTGRSRPESRPYSAKSLAAQAAEQISSPYPRSSPVVTDQQRALVAEVHKTSQERLASPAKGRRTSITAVKDLLSDTRKSFSERRKSTTIDPITNLSRSPTQPDMTHHNSAQSPNGQRSSQDFGGRSPSIMSDENSEKKASRASRMLNRISSSVSASRKTISLAMSPTVREESEQSFEASIPDNAPPAGEATTVLQMGDVNVQFPDNLLWKRRAMCLDSHGYLILTQSQNGTDRNTGAKKYHLAEFTRPAVPDIDMEEMPNSVVLSFVKGSGLQFACADRQGQMWVLKQLQDAHENWTQQ